MVLTDCFLIFNYTVDYTLCSMPEKVTRNFNICFVCPLCPGLTVFSLQHLSYEYIRQNIWFGCHKFCLSNIDVTKTFAKIFVSPD